MRHTSLQSPSLSLQTTAASHHHHHHHHTNNERQRSLWFPSKIYLLPHPCNWTCQCWQKRCSCNESNTTEDPCIYDNNNLASVHRLKDSFCFWHFQLAWTYLSGTSFTIDIYYCVDPTSARDTWYQSAVRIQEQSRFYFPRSSWIWFGQWEATADSRQTVWLQIATSRICAYIHVS